MPGIDAHQHFWKYDPVKDAWIDDSMQAIRKDFLPEELGILMEANGISGCIAVQADQSEQENEFLLDLADRHDYILGVIGWTDLRSPQLTKRLQHYRSFKKMKGFRHILQDETDRALMLRPEFRCGIALLEQYGFTYDLLIRPDQLLFATELALAFPRQQFVLDHMAKPDIRNAPADGWAADIRRLARCPNVSCKLSGLVTEAHWHQWKAADFMPYLDIVSEAFGPQRLLFGSDWPVCLLSGSYKEVTSLAGTFIQNWDREAQQAVWGGNAQRIYNL